MCGKATGRHDRRGPLRITTEISPDDHRDYTRSLAGEGIEEAKALESARGLSRARFTMYLAMAAFFGALVWVVYGWGLDGLLDTSRAMASARSLLVSAFYRSTIDSFDILGP